MALFLSYKKSRIFYTNIFYKERKRKNMKKAMIIAVTICVVLLGGVCVFNTSSTQRQMKSLRSDISGGLERTVTVYDYNGKEIRHWTGKFDVSESESETYFDDEDGKRVVIHGGIVINEEQ